MVPKQSIHRKIFWACDVFGSIWIKTTFIPCRSWLSSTLDLSQHYKACDGWNGVIVACLLCAYINCSHSRTAGRPVKVIYASCSEAIPRRSQRKRRRRSGWNQKYYGRIQWWRLVNIFFIVLMDIIFLTILKEPQMLPPRPEHEGGFTTSNE